MHRLLWRPLEACVPQLLTSLLIPAQTPVQGRGVVCVRLERWLERWRCPPACREAASPAAVAANQANPILNWFWPAPQIFDLEHSCTCAVFLICHRLHMCGNSV